MEIEWEGTQNGTMLNSVYMKPDDRVEIQKFVSLRRKQSIILKKAIYLSASFLQN